MEHAVLGTELFTHAKRHRVRMEIFSRLVRYVLEKVCVCLSRYLSTWS